jgi:hypothetical protein
VTSASAGINGATVVLREVRVVSYDSRSWTTNWSTFVLRNLARKEAFTLRRGGQTPGVSLTSRFLLMGEGVSSVTWLVPASTDSTQLHLDKDWFAGAEIVRVEHEDLGTFERPLHAEFTVKQ